MRTETGRRMPAEWEPHDGTWLSWPHNPDTWPGAFERVEPAYREMVLALASSEPVHINVLDSAHEAHVRAIMGIAKNIHYHRIPTNDAWCRDHGATIVHAGTGREAVDFDYNAWGGKYPPFDLDAVVARRMAMELGIPRTAAGFYLEGGAIEVNGAGVLMTTESCALNPNRNPGMTREQAESRLGDLLGTTHTLWVEGDLAGDDTDGHIDNLARFVSDKDIVMSVPGHPSDEAHLPLQAAFAKLSADAARLGIRVHPLPLPAPVFFTPVGEDPIRLPASHANFYIGNHAVVIPAYGSSSDEQAVRILQGFFPDRSMLLVDCRDLVWGLGAVHCLTQQIPSEPESRLA